MTKATSYYDVHCHILPGMDDGPADIDASMALARAYVDDGALGVIATPHVTLGSDLDSFLQRRAEAHLKLEGAIAAGLSDFMVKLGAEVMMKHRDGAKQAYEALGRRSRDLCLGDSNLLLVEYTLTGEPLWFEESLYRLQDLGVQPVIAHMERYSWLKDRARVEKLADKGIYMQMNVTSLKGMFSGDAIRARKLVRSGLVHFLATDSHSAENRKPEMASSDSRLVADVLMNSAKLFDRDGAEVLYI